MYPFSHNAGCPAHPGSYLHARIACITEIPLESFMKNRFLALLVVLIFSTPASLAVSPQFWERFSQEDLLKGTLTRVSIDPEGKLFLAPAYDLAYDTGQPYAFSMVRDKAGNVYVGTGHEGKVFKNRPARQGGALVSVH